VIEDTAAAGSLEMGIVASAGRLTDPPRTFEAITCSAGLRLRQDIQLARKA
jgi:hypothetical protein